MYKRQAVHHSQKCRNDKAEPDLKRRYGVDGEKRQHDTKRQQQTHSGQGPESFEFHSGIDEFSPQGSKKA